MSASLIASRTTSHPPTPLSETGDSSLAPLSPTLNLQPLSDSVLSTTSVAILHDAPSHDTDHAVDSMNACAALNGSVASLIREAAQFQASACWHG